MTPVTMEHLCNRLRFYENCKGRSNCPENVDKKISEVKDAIVNMAMEMYPRKQVRCWF